jgi:two-component system nitrogen regulation sensor histidine kinase NtrY
MPASIISIAPQRASLPSPAPVRGSRRPLRDRPWFVAAGLVALAGLLAALLWLASLAERYPAEFLTESVLDGLTAADLAMVAALALVLARTLVTLVVEQRRGRPFAGFRTRLVTLLLGLTLVPSMAVLIVGSGLIRSNIDRWFSTPMTEILSSANRLAADYYQERQARVGDDATRIARALAAIDLGGTDAQAIRDVLIPEIGSQRVRMIALYRAAGDPGTAPSAVPLLDVAAPTVPRQYDRATADRLAAQALGGATAHLVEAFGESGDLLHAAAVIPGPDARPAGVVVATDYLAGELAARARGMTAAFEGYNQLRVLRRPLTGLYLSFFLMVTLVVLAGSTWTGLYMARRIASPVQALATAAREVGARRVDHPPDPGGGDELGAVTEGLNAVVGELSATRRKVERSTVELERKHQEVEARRRYIETILERITTGVVSVDAMGAITTINGAAARLLSLDRGAVGRPVRAVFERRDLQPLGALIAAAARGRSQASAQEFALARGGQEAHLAAVATAFVGESGTAEGVVLVLDDVTPLIRAQKVAAWREVARRLAHEIKNPLTPIQLSAERLRRHFTGGPAGARALVDECTGIIVGEVESLKGLVDEFSQFARMPSPRTIPTDLRQLIGDTLALYKGLFADVRLEQRFASDDALVRLDPEQIRRVIINLVDNAIEAMERRGVIVIEAQRDPGNNVVRIVVADNGPGIPAEEREKLFLPYYSTKRRGSGLGLAIVRRIIAEHGGSIEVGDNAPRGTRFTIELPC